MNNFQRVGSISNAHVGRDFEEKIKYYFKQQEGVDLQHKYTLNIGAKKKKPHEFDLGINSDYEKIVIECKSHTWTGTDNVPSAKITVWNEAMYYFSLVPNEYRKIFCVLKSYSERRGLTLAQYYIDKYYHLIPEGVEIWEYNYDINKLEKVNECCEIAD